MVKVLKIPILLLVILFQFNSLANRHEHFFSWPLSSSIMDSFEEVYGRSIGELNVNEILQIWTAGKQGGKEDILNLVLNTIYSSKEISKLKKELNIPTNIHKSEQKLLLLKGLENKSIDFLISKMFDTKPGTTEHKEAIKSLFKFQNKTPRGDKPYNVKETLRQKLFTTVQSLKEIGGKENSPEHFKEFLYRSFEKTADKLPDTTKNFVGVSVPPSFFNEELKDLKQRMKNKDINMDFYLSVSRNIITTKNTKKHIKFLDKTATKVQTARKQGWGNGIDLTGSIFETDRELNSDEIKNTTLTFTRFAESLGGETDTVFRIHAFEATNKGSFYKVLYRFLDDVASGNVNFNGTPPVFSIGHIGAIDDQDIEKFQSISQKAKLKGLPFKVVFDANILSNYELHGVSRQEIVQKIEKLKKAGFEVGIGSDGSGILGKMSSVDNQVKILEDQGMDRKVANEIKMESQRAPVCNVNSLKNLIEEEFR